MCTLSNSPEIPEWVAVGDARCSGMISRVHFRGGIGSQPKIGFLPRELAPVPGGRRKDVRFGTCIPLAARAELSA